MAFQFKPNFITIICGLVFVVLVSMFVTSTSYVPYDGPVHTTYEGFQEGNDTDISESAVVDSSVEDASVEDKKEKKEKEGFFEGVLTSSVEKGNLKSSPEGFNTLSPSFLSGTGGVYSDPVNKILSNQLTTNSLFASPMNSDEHLDKFLDVTTVGVAGKNGCQSSGLSNSRGALCLSPDLIQALQTRGGNAGNSY